MEACINLLIHHRRSAKVSSMNPYVFAMPSAIEEEAKRSLEIVPLLSKFAKACGAELPHVLKSVELRKHIATVGIKMQLSNSEVEALSGFMGHDVAIHKGIYRQRLPVNDIVKMSRLLEKAQGLYVETESGESRFIDEEEESDIDPDENNICESTLVNNDEWNKSLNNSLLPRAEPVIPGVRVQWTPAEKSIVLSKFSERWHRGISIPGKEIQNVIDSNPCLRNRTVAKVRSFLQVRAKPASETPLRQKTGNRKRNLKTHFDLE
ncbi:hypothetical protein FQR65_LT18584 [Abscondita terminalis]|nr:hypothetical protein FQR65_LT18584 [Abscondita terminalis]